MPIVANTPHARDLYVNPFGRQPRQSALAHTPRYEFAVYIIKPEAMRYRTRIRALLETHFKLVGSKTVWLARRDIAELYPGITPRLAELSLAHLGGRRAECGVVWGKDAIARLRGLRGQHPDVRCCARSTIRYRFGRRQGTRIGATIYFDNGFHASSDKIEASGNRNLYARHRGSAESHYR